MVRIWLNKSWNWDLNAGLCDSKVHFTWGGPMGRIRPLTGARAGRGHCSSPQVVQNCLWDGGQHHHPHHHRQHHHHSYHHRPHQCCNADRTAGKSEFSRAFWSRPCSWQAPLSCILERWDGQARGGGGNRGESRRRQEEARRLPNPL